MWDCYMGLFEGRKGRGTLVICVVRYGWYGLPLMVFVFG